MDTLNEIIARRAAPGVLILDLEDRLLFSNEEALEMLSALQGDKEHRVPGEVYELCRKLRGGSKGAAALVGVIRHREEVSGVQYALRALLLGSHGDGNSPSHVMVLMEKVIRNRQVDLEKAREKFQLSKRETDVVRLICQGLGNKEISGTIYISEFTVKDHVKNILRKMGAASRNEIMAALL